MHRNTAVRSSGSDATATVPVDLSVTALLLDIDGTILDVAITPGSVVVSDALRSSLRELHHRCGGALALVSGRLIRDIDDLFAPLRLPAIGGHGAEMRLSGESPTQTRPTDVIADNIRRLVTTAAAIDPRIIMEDKGTSLAVHYRLAPLAEPALKAKFAAMFEQVAALDLEVMYGKAVIEIKSSHFSKGTAVRELMRNPPFSGRKPIFVGDDTTDLSVFQILPPLGGTGFSVETPLPGANGFFSSPHEVRSWLAGLCGHEGTGRQ